MSTFVLLGFLLRLVLLYVTGTEPLHPVTTTAYGSASLTAQILGIGLINDLVAGGILSSLWFIGRLLHRRVLQTLIVILCFVALIIVVAEFIYWREFSNRIDRMVFHYLIYPQEVAVFLHDQFSVGLLLIPLLGLLVWMFRICGNWLPVEQGSTSLTPSLLGLATAALLAATAMPLTVSSDRLANNLASNGYLEVLRAAKINITHWRNHYWSPPSTTATTEVQTPIEHSELPAALKRRPKHLVLIIEESFAGTTWRNPTERQQYLPHFDRLMQQSLYFDNAFATGSRTTRGQEAMLAGFPPLPGVSTTQRPEHRLLPSLPRVLAAAGFYNAFIYAGWPNFSDFSTYWRSAGFDTITDRSNFAADGFKTSWGYADEYSFERLLTELDKLTQAHPRVFAATLTLSHHRPFDYPEGRVPWPSNERRSEFAMAYADWALHEFLTAAASRDWFKDTLFVVAADHGPRFYGAGPIPVESYRVPILVFAPELIKPATRPDPVSLISIPATLLDAVGLPNNARFYGQSLLRSPDELDQPRVIPVEHNYAVGLIESDLLTVLHNGKTRSSWTINKHGYTPADINESAAQRVANLFSTAHESLYSADP